MGGVVVGQITGAVRGVERGVADVRTRFGRGQRSAAMTHLETSRSCRGRAQ